MPPRDASAPPFCPCCGHNFVAERPVAIGPLSHDPRGDSCWRGAPLKLSPAMHLLLGSLLAAGGRIVERSVLEERVGFEGLSTIADVYVCRIRRALRLAGAPPSVILTVARRGYRVDARLLAELA